MYGLALVDPGRFPGFFPAVIENWLAVLTPAFASDGATNAEARMLATVVLAGFRGFLLDLCATGDSERVDAAVEHWIRTVCLA